MPELEAVQICVFREELTRLFRPNDVRVAGDGVDPLLVVGGEREHVAGEGDGHRHRQSQAVRGDTLVRKAVHYLRVQFNRRFWEPLP